jgi:hypothetical protein
MRGLVITHDEIVPPPRIHRDPSVTKVPMD